MTVAPGTEGAKSNMFDAALIWHDSGCSVIPIRADGTKRPAIEWKRNQVKSVHPSTWHPEFATGCGIGVVCGAVSGNLEMTELEGRATSEDSISTLWDTFELMGQEQYNFFDRLWTDGYVEITPSGGIHFLYRITDHEVPGNEKIARRPATPDELAAKPDDKIKVLAETRGEGGYVVVAPTGGTVHPSGRNWEARVGEIGQIPQITWEQRNWLHEAIRRVLDQMPEPVAPAPAPRVPQQRVNGLRPGDDFNDRADWREILEPHGWQIHHVQANTIYWTRPGKNRRDGHSATTGHAGQGDQDRLFVMSSATEFDTDVPLSKFFVYAHYEHRGDLAAATRELARQGYGDQAARFQAPDYDAPWEDWQPPSNVDNPMNGASSDPAPPLRLLPRSRNVVDHTLSGACSRFVREWGHLFWYVEEEKSWRVWNGTLWETDLMGAQVLDAFNAMTEVMLRETQELEAEAAADETKAPLAKSMRKHVQQCRNAARTSIATMIAGKVRTSASAFDADPRYLNLQNGVYDMVVDRFLPHDPKYMLTKVAGFSYDPNAKAAKSEVFLGDLLPSEQMREFTLQSLAYSLTGEADRKALFILQGIPNSGKTQITELAANLFGDYAVSVSPGTFTKRREHGPNPELHNMRGARFVYTSETSYEIQLDEELVKRITGKDTMSTRTLYERPQQWVPQCTVWIATNNLPRFGSDSDAMWKRVKTVRFVNEFSDDGSSGYVAQPNIGRGLAAEEGAGLFNLLLSALRRYRAAGRLAEPQELKDSVAAHREETDPLVQWVMAVQEMGQLVPEDGAQASQGVMRKAYVTFCEDQGHAALGAQRFGNAITAMLRCTKRRSNGETLIIGWRWRGPSWMIGHPTEAEKLL